MNIIPESVGFYIRVTRVGNDLVQATLSTANALRICEKSLSFAKMFEETKLVAGLFCIQLS